VPKIKRLEWSREPSGGYAGSAGGVQYRFVGLGWSTTEPFSYGGKQYASLDDAQQAAQADFEAYIRNALEAE
jgi:hypothetical protein